MPTMPPRRSVSRARTDRYHHGDLARALVTEAVKTIQVRGVEALTLRAVGASLGVSRSALYRHFADKQALLAAVAAEGFKRLTSALQSAWEKGGCSQEGFSAMGIAYVTFAVSHPAHYRVMFGGTARLDFNRPDLGRHASAAFQTLVTAILALQERHIVVGDRAEELAQYIWAAVHGIAMLAIDGQLEHQGTDGARLVRFVNARLLTGIGAG